MDVFFEILAGVGLVFMILVTLSDVLMRLFWRPIVGSIEIISFCGAIVVGFSLPYSSWKKVHVIVDILLVKLSPAWKIALQGVTKGIGILLFLFIGINFIIYGLDLIRTGEVSGGLRIPYYPIVFGLAVSCFLTSLTLLCDTLRLVKGGDHE